MTRPAAHTGFTLIEVLVGLALLMLMSVLLYAGLGTASRSLDTLSARAAAADDRRVVAGFLRARIAEALPLATARNGRWRMFFEGARDRLDFVTVLPPHMGEGAIHRVMLARVRGSQADRLEVIIRDFDPSVAAGDDQKRDGARVLVDGLERVEFDYFGAPRRDNEPRWQSIWTDAEQLPELVRVRIASRVDGAWPEVVVPIGARATRAISVRSGAFGRADPASDVDIEDADVTQ